MANPHAIPKPRCRYVAGEWVKVTVTKADVRAAVDTCRRRIIQHLTERLGDAEEAQFRAQNTATKFVLKQLYERFPQSTGRFTLADVLPAEYEAVIRFAAELKHP